MQCIGCGRPQETVVTMEIERQFYNRSKRDASTGSTFCLYCSDRRKRRQVSPVNERWIYSLTYSVGD